jgi:predicted ABC-type ATPase
MGGFDESAHPRDESGKFTSGGAGGGLKTWAEKNARGTGEGAERSSARAVLEPMPKLGEGRTRTFTDERPEGMSEHSYMDHYKSGVAPDDGGKPTDERKEKVHDPIIEHFFKTAGDSKAKPGEQKTAILTMGGPASGKSSMGLNTTNMVHVDPDLIKEKIPEFRDALHPDHTFRGAAAMVHEESSHLAKQIRQRALDEKHHIFIDGTGANGKKFGELIDHLKSRGYDVHVHMPDLHVDEGVKRAGDRAAKSGRQVPEGFIRDTYKAIAASWKGIAQKADHFTMYNANKAKTEKAFEIHHGEKTVHDKAFHDEMYKRP